MIYWTKPHIDSGSLMWTSTCLVVPKTSLVDKFLCLLNLQPTNLEGLTLSSITLAFCMQKPIYKPMELIQMNGNQNNSGINLDLVVSW